MLVLVHKNEDQTYRLISHLSKDFDVYVHIDKRAPFQLTSGGNIFVYKKYKPYWGSFNIVKATLLLLQKAAQRGYDRYILLSGQDLPLVSNSKLQDFFENNDGEYINSEPLPLSGWQREHGGFDRVTKYHAPLFQRGKKGLAKIASAIMYRLCRIPLRIVSRLKPRPVDYSFYGGSQWFCITGTCVKKMFDYLKSDKRYIRRFYLTHCADEIFFQTLVRLIGIANIHNYMRYIDWESGPEYPRTLRIADFEKIAQTHNLFARKFDETVDKQVIDKIYEKIGET